MAPSIRQTNFRAGELSPFLWGRDDLPTFKSGLRTCRNFFITRHGAAMSRPGMTYVAETLSKCRLIRFDAGDGAYDAYALEFGEKYIRFITNGGYVLKPDLQPYEVVTPYSYAEVWQLQFAQYGDVMILAHPNWDPLELSRHGHTAWSLTPFRFKAYAPYASDVGQAGAGTLGFAVVADTLYAPGPPPVYGFPPADIDHPAREWQWMWTALVRDKASGAIYETLGQLVEEHYRGGELGTASDADHTLLPLTTDHFAIFLDRPITLRRAETAGLLPAPDGWNSYDVLEYIIYRGRGGLFGFIGSTKSRDFIDVGQEPNYAVQPPQGTHPFGDETEATAAAAPFDTRRKDRPSAVAFFQERVVFGGLTRRSTDFYASKSGDYQNWDARLYIDVDGESLHYQLAARRKERIRSFAVLGRLLAFTNATSWSIGGQQGSPLDHDSVDVRAEDEVGALDLAPLIIESSALYARAKGRGVRALVPQGQQTPFSGVDLSQVAHHLFTGPDKELVDWTYAEDPFGLVWAVQADGSLLSLTYGQEGVAWAHHDTDGLVESVCAIPEGDEDAVYLVVARQVLGVERRFIERMTSRVHRGGAEVDATPSVVVPPDNICIDFAIEYFGPPDITIITGLGLLEGKSVWVLVEGLDPIGPLVVQASQLVLGQTLRANLDTPLGPKLLLHVGLAFTCDMETLDVTSAEARLKNKTISHAGFEVDEARGLKGGMNFTDMDEFDQRTLDDGYNPVSNATVLAHMPIPSEYNLSARLCLRQERPLPITVVGVTRELGDG